MSNRDGSFQIYVMNSDASKALPVITFSLSSAPEGPDAGSSTFFERGMRRSGPCPEYIAQASLNR